MTAYLPQVLFLLEILSVIMLGFYMYFAAKRNANAWLFGTAGSLMSMVLFYYNGYIGSMVLNLIYILQGLSGYFHWKWLDKEKKVAFRFKLYQHLLILLFCPLMAILIKEIFTYFNFEGLYFWDFLLASGSIAATFLEIRKDISCWIYWIVCNLAYTVLYFINPSGSEPMYFYATLMLSLAVFSIIAMQVWLKSANPSEPGSLQQ